MSSERDELSRERPGADPRQAAQHRTVPVSPDDEPPLLRQEEVPHVELPGYAIRTCLGRGGMGMVFLARQANLDRDVAVKMLALDKLQDSTALERLQQEARTLAKLEHPNIVAVYDVGVHEGYAFVVMQFVPGRLSVDRLVEAFDTLPQALAVDLVRQTALGLRYAHEKGFIHRDIKPENLLLYRDTEAPLERIEEVLDPDKTRVMIVDFGLARAAMRRSTDPRMTQEGMVMGSPAYMSPEQLVGDEPDQRSDIYALGATFYAMLSGVPPLLGDTVKQTLQMKLQQEAPPIRRKTPGVDPEVARVLHKMLAREPEDRYQDYDELLYDLNAMQMEMTTRLRMGTMAPAGKSPLPGKPLLRKRVLLLGALIFVVGLLVGYFYTTPDWMKQRRNLLNVAHLADGWEGDLDNWHLSHPDDSSRRHALIGQGENVTLRQRSALALPSEVRFRARLPTAGSTGAVLVQDGRERLRLTWERPSRSEPARFLLLVDGEAVDVKPPDTPAEPSEWRQFSLRVFHQMVFLKIDEQLAAFGRYDEPAERLHFGLFVGEAGMGQYTQLQTVDIKTSETP